MDISEAEGLKQTYEDQILELLRDFTAETGMEVAGLDLDTSQLVGGGNTTRTVEIEAKL